MIEKISIKNASTFVAKGGDIDDLRKINFFYGANATGKTTISNFLNNPEDEAFADCSIKWKNDTPIQTLVYNKRFREQNFGHGKIAGIFTLGKASSEQIREIDEKRNLLKSRKEEGLQNNVTINNQEEEKNRLDDSFKEFCWKNIYKKYENDFKEAFRGSLQKESFMERLIQEYSNNKPSLLSFDEIIEKSKIVFGKQLQPMGLIPLVDCTEIVAIENNTIWNKIIIGKADVDIASLINKLNIADWVNQGRNYIGENDICPFCQQHTINENFRRQIESLFDVAYRHDLETVKTLKNDYSSMTLNVVNQIDDIENTQKSNPKTKLDVNLFSSYAKSLISLIAANKEMISNKEKEPSRKVELNLLLPQFEIIDQLIRDANNEIKKHNDIVANYNSEKTKLIDSIWKFVSDESKGYIDEYLKKKRGLEFGITKLKQKRDDLLSKYKLLDSEIKELTKNTTSIQPAIDEINRLLTSFGFLNFMIVPADEKGFYQIKRENGTIAENTLSEGEVTFITFLYFMQLAKGGLSEEKVNAERVLVIDDPISSLDSNVLFVVSSLLKEIIKDIKDNKGTIRQLILLTHNIYFHKEVSFVDGRTKNNRDTHFWIIRKTDKVSSIQNFSQENPISTSYELLWKELRREGDKSIITIQNVMRCIIEYYFKLLGKYGDDKLINSFTTQIDREICRSLICWINEGSHDISDPLFIESQDLTVDNYMKVFKEIFVQNKNEGHYNMMMGIENTSEEEDE